MSTPKTGFVEHNGRTFAVTHCGHPTALWPWLIVTDEGEQVIAPNGRAFQYKQDAMAAAKLLLEGKAQRRHFSGSMWMFGNGNIVESWELIRQSGGHNRKFSWRA